MTPQPVTINFADSVNTKADPFQVPSGQFLRLENTVFTIAGRMTKRNGYGLLATIPSASSVTTFSGNLLALSNNALNLYSENTKTSSSVGTIQPLGLNVKPLVRRATGQTTVDTAVAPNGLACSVWLDSNASSYYQINDANNGGTIVPAVSITTGTDTAATMPRVFVLGNYFIITYTATVSATHTLRYIAIPLLNPSVPLAPVTIATTISSITGAYDAIVAPTAPDTLYIAWNGSDGGTAIRFTSMTSTLAIGSVTAVAGVSADLISLAWDVSRNQLWITWYLGSANNIRTRAYNQSLTNLLTTTTLVSSITLNNGLTSTANAGILSIFYEVSNTYTYDSTLRTDFVSTNTCTLAGVVGTPAVLVRSVGLGSKAKYLSTTGKSYMFCVFGSAYQPSYFLMDSSGNTLGKVAYSNGDGYTINQILPQINVSTNDKDLIQFQTGYLFKDFLASIANPVGPSGADTGTNKTMGAANTVPIYTQTGINLSTFTFNTPVPTAETGGILHMGMGFPWMFDGVKPVEHQFHVWPDAVEVTSANSAGGMLAQQYYYQALYYWIDGAGNPQYSAPSVPVTTTVTVGSGVTFHSVFSSGDTSITVSSASGLFVGQVITDSTTGGNITTGTYITSIVGTTVGLSLPAAGSSTTSPGDALVTTQQGTATVYVPTLRLTAKTSNKVIIKIYRWSTAQQEFFEVTSVASPTLNDPSVDYITFTDHKSDVAIAGNSLIYTTGGVVEDVAAPSFSVCSMFDDRLWIVDAEDPFTMWYSKQVIAGTGVEFSDLFTFYVAPTQGAQGSTGPITALAPMDTELIVFKKDAMYYINGTGPDNTGANNQYSQPIYISSTVGCSNPNSIILTDAGIMFQSDKGIWLLGRGLQPEYIGAMVEKYIVGNNVTSAAVIPGTTQVRFTVDTGITVMYDYFYNKWGTFSNTLALSATLYQDLHTYLNPYGQVVQETPGQYLDIATPVLLGFETGNIQLQGLSGYQMLLEFLILGSYVSPHKLNVQIAYDYGPLSEHAEITPINNTGLYGSDDLYGQTSPYGGPGSLEQWRVQPSTLQCQAFRISIDEVFDPSIGQVAGAGFTLSAIIPIIGLTRSYRPIRSQNSIGTGA